MTKKTNDDEKTHSDKLHSNKTSHRHKDQQKIHTTFSNKTAFKQFILNNRDEILYLADKIYTGGEQNRWYYYQTHKDRVYEFTDILLQHAHLIIDNIYEQEKHHNNVLRQIIQNKTNSENSDDTSIN